MASKSRIFTSAIQQSTDSHLRAPAGSKNVQVPAKRGRHSVFDRFDDWDQATVVGGTARAAVRGRTGGGSGKGLISDSSGEFALLKNSSTVDSPSIRHAKIMKGLDSNSGNPATRGNGFDSIRRGVISNARRAPYGAMRSTVVADSVTIVDDEDCTMNRSDDCNDDDCNTTTSGGGRAYGMVARNGDLQRGRNISKHSRVERRLMAVEPTTAATGSTAANGRASLNGAIRKRTTNTVAATTSFAPTALVAAVNAAVADTSYSSPTGDRRWRTASALDYSTGIHAAGGRWGRVPEIDYSRSSRILSRGNREVVADDNVGGGEWEHDMFGVVESDVNSSGGYYHSSAAVGSGGSTPSTAGGVGAAALDAAVVGSRLFIRSLGNNCTKAGVEDAFSRIDKVVSIAIERGPLTTAVVGFRKRGSAQQAVEALQGTVVQGKPVKLAVMLSPDKNSKDNGGGDDYLNNGTTTSSSIVAGGVRRSRYGGGYDVVQQQPQYYEGADEAFSGGGVTKGIRMRRLVQLAQKRRRRSAVLLGGGRVNTAAARRMVAGGATSPAGNRSGLFKHKLTVRQQPGGRVRGGRTAVNKFLPNDQRRQSVFNRLTDN